MVEGGANGDKGMLFSESYKGLIRNYKIKSTDTDTVLDSIIINLNDVVE
jgi:hypothetical protein